MHLEHTKHFKNILNEACQLPWTQNTKLQPTKTQACKAATLESSLTASIFCRSLHLVLAATIFVPAAKAVASRTSSAHQEGEPGRPRAGGGRGRFEVIKAEIHAMDTAVP